MFYAQIAQRAFNTPLLVEPSKAMAFLSGLGPRITGRQLHVAGVEISPEDMAHVALPARAGILTNGLAEQYQQDGQTPFAMVDGVAVIEVSGVLVHRGAWTGQSSGQTSYEGIAAQLGAAASDPAVRGIALEIDSFGGEVAGVFDLADAVRAARSAKPVWAFVAEHAAVGQLQIEHAVFEPLQQDQHRTSRGGCARGRTRKELARRGNHLLRKFSGAGGAR